MCGVCVCGLALFVYWDVSSGFQDQDQIHGGVYIVSVLGIHKLDPR